MIINKSICILLLSVFVASCSQIILKTSAEQEHTSIIKEYLNWRVIIGYGMMFLSTILTILAFKGLDFKNGPVIEASGYIFVVILSRIFLAEKITRKKVIGNLLILTGIVVFYL